MGDQDPPLELVTQASAFVRGRGEGVVGVGLVRIVKDGFHYVRIFFPREYLGYRGPSKWSLRMKRS